MEDPEEATGVSGGLTAVCVLMPWDPVGEESVLTESLHRNVAKLWGVVRRLSVTSRIDQGTFTASLLHFPWKATMPKVSITG